MLTDRRPNILLILQDQLRYDVVADGNLCATPTLDRLRREGAWFESAYTPTALCSPARASLFTGVLPHTHGLMNNTHTPDALARNLSRDHATVAELLRKEGYATAYVGKWHLGMDDGPLDRGFDTVRLDDGDPGAGHGPWMQAVGQLPSTVFSRFAPVGDAQQARFPRRPRALYSSTPVPNEIVPASLIEGEAVQLVSDLAGAEEPFFLVVSYLEPHWPHVLPEPFASMYDPNEIQPWPNFHDDFVGKPGANRANMEKFGVAELTWEDWAPVVAAYLGATSMVDESIGRLLEVLERSGAAPDSYVIATTDHGDLSGSHRQFNKGTVMYEEVYRIPLVIRGPGIQPTSHDRLVCLTDLMPTFLELAGEPVDDSLDGRSLVAALRGDDEVLWRDALLCEFHGDEFGLYSQRMVRWKNFKLVYNPNDLRELYDLEADPAEMNNLAYDATYAEVRCEIELVLLGLMHESGDPLAEWAVNLLG